jgi:alcohol dehydrogenase, propanol-preferring
MTDEMHAMVLTAPGAPLRFELREDPAPGPGDVRVKVSACGVCRTDLHVVDGELPDIAYPIVPGHEVVGRVDALGAGVMNLKIGERVGVPWLGHTCGECFYCRSGRENLCDRPRFTGYTRDGGFATHLVADARYCFPLGEAGDDDAIAPLLCAGLIGWRSLVMAGDGTHLGIFGFGAAGHIIAQVARWQGRSVYAFTRAGDVEAQGLAKSLGADWAGGVGRPAAGTARRSYHLRAGRLPRAVGVARCSEGRTRGLRRHLHVGYSLVPLPHPLGRTAAAFGRQPHA